MTQEVLCVVTVLLSHQIDDVESIESPNNGQSSRLHPTVTLAAKFEGKLLLILAARHNACWEGVVSHTEKWTLIDRNHRFTNSRHGPQKNVADSEDFSSTKRDGI
jgi:hypothetical protein